MVWRKKMAFLLSLLMVCSMADISAFGEEQGEPVTPPAAEEPLAEESPEEEPEEDSAEESDEAEDAPAADAEILAVQEKINALPAADALSAAAYADVQAAYDAYDALDAAQQAQITGAERFEALFAWFAAQTKPLANEEKGDVAAVIISKQDGTTATTSYAALPDALQAAAKSGGTVQLLRDVEYEDLMGKEDTYTFPSGTYTLDLNGKTINQAIYKWTIPANATLTIKSSAESKGKIEEDLKAVITNEGNLTLENVWFDASWDGLIFSKGTVKANRTIFDGSPMHIMGGTFSATNSDFEETVYIHGGEVDLQTCQATDRLYLFSGKLTLADSNMKDVQVSRNSDFPASDGTQRSDGTLIMQSGTLNTLGITLIDTGKVEIQSGKIDTININGKCEGIVNIRNATIRYLNNLGSPKLNIYSGTITDKMPVKNKSVQNIQLYGGTFSGGIQMEDSKGKIGTLLAEGMDFRKADGTWATPEDRNGRELLQALTVEKAPLLSATITPEEKDITYGESLTLTMNAVRADGITKDITYKWYLDDVEDTTQTGATFLFPADKSVRIGTNFYAVKCEVTCDNYTFAQTAKIHVNRKSINHPDITVSIPEFTFSPKTNGTGDGFSITKKGSKNILLQDNGVEITDGYYLSGDTSGADAGTYTLVIDGGSKNYTGTRKVEWKILPYEIPSNHTKPVQLKQKEYDGTNKGEVATFTFYTNSSRKVTLQKDAWYFSSDVTYESAEVGTNYDVTAKVTLESGNYIFPGGAKTKEFALSEQSIVKNATKVPVNEKVYIRNQLAHTYEMDLASLLQAPKGTPGDITQISALSTNMTSEGYLNSAKIEEGKLKLDIAAKDTTAEGAIGTITFQIETTHYQEFDLTFTLYAQNKTPLTGAPTLSKTNLTYGDALSDIALSGTMTDAINGGSVAGLFTWKNSDETPNAGVPSVDWIFTPQDTDTYAVQNGTISIMVDKAKPSGTPSYTPITKTDRTYYLQDTNLGVGTITPEGTIQWDNAIYTAITQGKAYGWTFTPTDTANYENLTGQIIPWEKEKEPEPVTPPAENPGGNPTEKPGGNPSETPAEKPGENPGDNNTNGGNPGGSTNNGNTNNGNTNNGNSNHGNSSGGSHSKPGNSAQSTAGQPSVAPADAVGTVTIAADGIADEATISSAAIADAVENGTTIRLPLAVDAGKNNAEAPTLFIALGTAADVTVEIPVANGNRGTVAILVHEDGTEEIIKTTIWTESGIQITIPGDAMIKVVDNSKEFIDTKGHWAEDAVQFVAARGILSGISADSFGVNEPMTRGMLDMALARLAGADIAGGKPWYEKGVAWAIENGVSDGTSPEAAITREQLVAILYRFAGAPAVEGELDFADAADVSDYAKQAMLWAMQNDIISGMSDGRLAPRDLASRGQVAAVLMHWLEG